jgi:hypothetical protein
MNVSLNDILNSYKKNIKEFDYDNINDVYKDTYEELLKYYLINPHNLDEIKEGDIIRYSNDISKISCAGIVVKIEYNKETIDYYILKSLVYKKTWRIYPHSYYIFQYDKSNTKEFYKVIKEYKKEDKIPKKKKEKEFLSIDELIKQNEKYIDDKTRKKINNRFKKIFPDLI